MDLSSQLSANKNDIAGLLSCMNSFEERLKKATTASPPPQPDLAALARDFVDFKTSVWQMLTKLAAQTELLSHGFDRHEMFLRRKVLLIHGLPENKEEKLSESVINLLTERMKIPDVSLGDIQTCHRMGASTKKPRLVLVRFRDLEVRRLAWEAKTALKGTGITVTEFLTKSRQEVFMAGRKHFGFKNCWTSSGRIVVALPDKSRRKIETAKELQALCAAYPAIKVAAASRQDAGRVSPAVQPASAVAGGRNNNTAATKAAPATAAASRRPRNKP